MTEAATVIISFEITAMSQRIQRVWLWKLLVKFETIKQDDLDSAGLLLAFPDSTENKTTTLHLFFL